MHAAFILEARIDAVALDQRDHFLQPAHTRLRRGEHFHLPLLRLGIAVVHAEDFRHEQRGLIAARPSANFEDHVLLVVRILGQQENLEFFLNGHDAGFELRQFLFGVGAHVRIGLIHQHGAALGDAALQILVLAILLDDPGDFAVRLGSLLVFCGIVGDIRRQQRSRQFLVAHFDLVKSLEHQSLVAGRWSLGRVFAEFVDEGIQSSADAVAAATKLIRLFL